MSLSLEEKLELQRFKSSAQGKESQPVGVPVAALHDNDGDDDFDDFGPAPAAQLRDLRDEKRQSYGGNLLSGEGAAMASFVQQVLR
jgi:hypothetical protein